MKIRFLRKVHIDKNIKSAIISARDEDDRGLGWIVISAEGNRGKIEDITFTSDKRQLGIGKQLVEKAEKMFRDSSVEKAYTSSVTPGAEGFWDKLGYKQRFGSRSWEKLLR